MSERETAQAIEEQAIAWVTRLDRGVLAPEEKCLLDEWLAGDERRSGALARAEASWRILDRLRVLGPGTYQEAAHEIIEDDEGRNFSRRRLLVASVASAAFLGIGGTAWLREPEGELFETRIGQARDVSLADGSFAALNTASRIEVAMNDESRNVRLLDGEVWFQVKKDRARPFVVDAGNLNVRAVGTAFSVRREGNSIEILVTEGTVEVKGNGDITPIRLSEGYLLLLGDPREGVRLEKAPDEIARRLAWRTGEIDLGGISIAEAVTEFNRYNVRQLIVADPALAQEKLVGRFRTKDPESFARAISASFGAQLTVQNNYIEVGRADFSYR